jgi:DNA-binding NtrC family response regulator
MFDYPKVLLLCSSPDETQIMQQILRHHALLRTVQDIFELQDVLEPGKFDAVLCGWSYRQGTWREVLKLVQRRCADVPVIVFSSLGAEQEWIEVLEAGAFDLLIAPCWNVPVLAVVEQAIASHAARAWHKGDVLQKVI